MDDRPEDHRTEDHPPEDHRTEDHRSEDHRPEGHRREDHRPSPGSRAPGGLRPESDGEPRRRPRRRPDLDAIFGDVLPSTTSDERDPDPPSSDEWYERNRPPHHGG